MLEHTIHCWHCSTPFDAYEAAWCGCSRSSPTKICPFCYTCACSAPPSYLAEYRRSLPQALLDELGKQGQPRKRIGELLVEHGRITDEQLQELLDLQRLTGVRLGDLLVDHGIASREEVSRHVAEQQDLQVVDIDMKSINVALLMSVGPKVCLQHNLVPLDCQEFSNVKILIVAVAEPLRAEELEKLGEQLACKVYQKFAPTEQVHAALERIKKLLLLGRRKS